MKSIRSIKSFRSEKWDKATLKEVVSYLPVVSLLVTLFSMVFYYSQFQRIALIVLGACYVLDYTVNVRWRKWKWRNYMSIYVVMIVLWFLPSIWQIFDSVPATSYYRYYLEMSLPFLVFGVIGVMGMTDKLQLRYVAWTMLLASMTLECLVLCDLWNLGTMENLHAHYISLSSEYNVHMWRNLYFNAAVFISIAVIPLLKHRYEKILTGALVVLTSLSVIISEGRAGLIAQLLGLLIISLYYIPRRLEWLKGLSVLILAVVSVCWVMTSDKMTSTARSQEPRPVIWRYSCHKYLEKPILGYGFSSLDVEFAQAAMYDPVMKPRYVDFIRGEYQFPQLKEAEPSLRWIHPHNMFLQYGLGFGIVGIATLSLLFLLCALYPCKKEYRLSLYLILVAYLIQGMTEPIGPGMEPTLFSALLLMLYHAK